MNGELTEGLNEALTQASEHPGTPGELLREARMRRGLTLQHAAEDLHLDVRMVEAIEANRFAELGVPVYAKGHLRKYAMLLGLSPELVLERYQMLGDTPEVPTPVPAVGVTRDRPRMTIPLSLLALALVGLGTWWAVEQDASGDRATVTSSVTADRQETAPEVESPRPVASASVEMADDAGGVEPIASATAAPQMAAAAPEGEVRLQLDFAEACWVEVYDAEGGRLLFEVGQPGATRSVAGTPPLQVVLGVASAVTAHVNDRSVVIPRVAGRDATRFVVDPDGTVR